MAQAGAYSLYWFLGDRAHRERAMEGFEKVLISGVLFGVALILVNLSLWGLNIFISLAGVPGHSAIKALNQTKSWQDFGSRVQAALEIAERTYDGYRQAAWSILAGYAALVAGFGVLPWTSAVSMAVMNAFAFVATAATTVLISAAVYAIAAAMAKTWPALLPLGAVLVAYERTRNLGSWLLALSVVAPVVLAAGADVLASRVDALRLLTSIPLAGAPLSPPWLQVDPRPLLEAMVILGLIGLALSTLSYAASRLFDHAGAHLSLD